MTCFSVAEWIPTCWRRCSSICTSCLLRKRTSLSTLTTSSSPQRPICCPWHSPSETSPLPCQRCVCLSVCQFQKFHSHCSSLCYCRWSLAQKSGIGARKVISMQRNKQNIPVNEIPEIRVLLLEWQVILHLYVKQYVCVWGNGCTLYRLTHHGVNLRVSAEECLQTDTWTTVICLLSHLI